MNSLLLKKFPSCIFEKGFISLWPKVQGDESYSSHYTQLQLKSLTDDEEILKLNTEKMDTGLLALICNIGLKGLSPKDIHKEIVLTLVEGTPSYSMVQKWATELKCGRENLEDDHHPRRLVTTITGDHEPNPWYDCDRLINNTK